MVCHKYLYFYLPGRTGQNVVWYTRRLELLRWEPNETYKPSPDNKDYFGGNEISHIVSDKQGNLFFTSDGKLIRYDLHKDRFLSLPLRTQTLFAHNHTIWTAVNDSVFQWDREQETFRFVYQAPFHKTIIAFM